MHRLFTKLNSTTVGTEFIVDGEDAIHIGRSLRSRIGDEFCVSSDGCSYPSEIIGFTDKTVQLRITGGPIPTSEPCKKIILYQALTKGESNDGIIRRAAECGISEIIFFVSSCCVAKPGNDFEKKLERFRRISKEAAMQSGRDIIPIVNGCLTFEELILSVKNEEFPLFCYEKQGIKSINEIINGNKFETVAIIIGPEGGFTPVEADIICNVGAHPVSLGKRILRAETASAVAASYICCLTE